MFLDFPSFDKIISIRPEEIVVVREIDSDTPVTNLTLKNGETYKITEYAMLIIARIQDMTGEQWKGAQEIPYPKILRIAGESLDKNAYASFADALERAMYGERMQPQD